MKRLLAVVALTALLSVTTMAGEIPTGDVVAPPPPPNRPSSSQVQDSTVSEAQTYDSTDLDLFDSFILSIASLLVR